MQRTAFRASLARRLLGGWLACLLWLHAPSLLAAPLVAIPALTGPVVDTTGSLSPDQASALDTQARRLRTSRGVQLQVLMVPSTGDEDIAAYANRVFGAWKLGDAKADNGVLVLIAKGDRRARIEVGYGLEGALTDAQTSQIIRDAMVPLFRKGDFGGGLVAGTAQLVQLVEAEVTADGQPRPRPAANPAQGGGLGLGPTLWVVLFACVFARGLVGWTGRPVRTLLLGAVGGGLGWFMGAAALSGGLGLLIGLLMGWLQTATAGGRYARSGMSPFPLGFSLGDGGGWGGSSSSSWGDSGGGGGWSGGGGSSGGGGASGSW